MTRKSYSKYKDSGIKWLGKIPAHWGIMPFKYNYRFSMGQTILVNDLENNGDIPVISATEENHYFGYISNPQFILEKGDFVIPARGISIGAVKKVIEPSISTQTTIYAKKRALQNLEVNFIFFYQIGCRKYLFQYDRTAIPQITVEQVKNNPVLLPPLSEQKAIAGFLDKETSRIDFLAQKKERQIELLREKRSALIAQAVTRGLGPKAKMRDSGIKWLGRVPEHWSITRFKYGIDIIESGKRDLVEYSNVLSIGGEHIGSNHQLNLKNLKYVSEDFYNQSKKGRVHKGDILIVKDGATIGKTAYVDENQLKQKMLLNEHVYRVAAHKYIYYFVLSSFFQSKVWSEDNSSAQEGLNLSTIKNIPLLEPSRKEQKAIAGFLDKETSRIDLLIEKIKKSIKLLKEWRAALIASAVTGRIDVRESQ